MKYFSFLLSFFLLLTAYLPGIAQADGVGLAISPPLIQIAANAPANVSTPITIENLTGQEADVEAAFQPIKASSKADGAVVPDGNMQALPSFVSIQDQNHTKFSHIRLAAYEKKSLFLSLGLQKPLQKDYYFSILFIQKSIKSNQANNKNSNTAIQAGIGLNVLLTSGAAHTPDIDIRKFATNFLIQEGPVPFNVEIENNGKQMVNEKSSIEIATIFNRPIASITLASSPILGESSRYLRQAVWGQTVLFGVYKATLFLSFPPDTKLYTRSIYFISFPFLLTGVLFLLIVGILLVKSRLKEK